MCRSLCEHWSLYRAAMLDLIARDANPSAPPHPATVTDSPSAPPLAPADATTPNTGANLERLEQLQLEMDEMLLDCARIFVSCAKYSTPLLPLNFTPFDKNLQSFRPLCISRRLLTNV